MYHPQGKREPVKYCRLDRESPSRFVSVRGKREARSKLPRPKAKNGDWVGGAAGESGGKHSDRAKRRPAGAYRVRNGWKFVLKSCGRPDCGWIVSWSTSEQEIRKSKKIIAYFYCFEQENFFFVQRALRKKKIKFPLCKWGVLY